MQKHTHIFWSDYTISRHTFCPNLFMNYLEFLVIFKERSEKIVSSRLFFNKSKGFNVKMQQPFFRKGAVYPLPHFGQNCKRWLSLSDWNAILLRVFVCTSFFFVCVVLLNTPFLQSTVKEIGSFYGTKRTMEQRIASLQS